MRSVYTAISVPVDLVKIIDREIKGKGFSSRAEFIKQAVRNELKRISGRGA